jgi:hypothetical protein
MVIIKEPTNAGEDSEKKEPLYTIGGNINLFRYYGNQYGVFSRN